MESEFGTIRCLNFSQRVKCDFPQTTHRERFLRRNDPQSPFRKPPPWRRPRRAPAPGCPSGSHPWRRRLCPLLGPPALALTGRRLVADGGRRPRAVRGGAYNYCENIKRLADARPPDLQVPRRTPPCPPWWCPVLQDQAHNNGWRSVGPLE